MAADNGRAGQDVKKTVEYSLVQYFIRDVESFVTTLNGAAADGWRLHSFAVDGTHLFGIVVRETLR